MKTSVAFVLGWLCTIWIFLAATVAEQLMEGRDIAKVELHPTTIAVVVTIYVMLAGWPAYASVDWFARGDGPSTSWLSYTKAALAASVPYFGVFVVLPLVWFGLLSHPVYWLAGLLSSLAYASIGYWLVERGWPWEWRSCRRDEE